MLAETQIIRQPKIPALDPVNHYLCVSSLPTSNSSIDDVLLDAVVSVPTLSPSVSSPKSTAAAVGVSIFPDALASESRIDSVCQLYRFDFFSCQL